MSASPSQFARALLFTTTTLAGGALSPQAALAESPAIVAAPALLPPAPNASLAPKAFEKWQTFVGFPAAQGWIKPGRIISKSTTAAHAPAQRLAPAASSPPGGVKSVISKNWSGSIFYDETQPFKVEAIMGEFVVPNAHQPLGGCEKRESSYWVGIDGWNEKGGPSSLLQAGISANSNCENGVATPKYHVWIEWLPIDDQHVDRPRARPGDLMFVEVWSVSPQKGYAYLYNHTLREGAIYPLTAPAPANALTGNSVEWILERPASNGKYTQLTNYSAVAAPFGVAWNYRSRDQRYYYPGKSPEPSMLSPTVTNYLATMVDDAQGVISTPYVENDHFLFFQSSGSSASVSK